MLINLQPYTKPMQVEVCVEKERWTVGTAQDSADKLDDMRGALRRLAEAVTEGLFSFREKVRWRFAVEFTNELDWRRFVEKPTCGGVQADRRQIETALRRPDGAVIVTDANLAAVYERRGAEAA